MKAESARLDDIGVPLPLVAIVDDGVCIRVDIGAEFAQRLFEPCCGITFVGRSEISSDYVVPSLERNFVID